MANLEKKYFYFIYSQNTLQNNIAHIENNKAVQKVTQIEEKKFDSFFYILYCLELSKDSGKKPFTITLINKNLDLYYKDVYPKDPCEFKYDMKFNLFKKEKKEKIDSLSQIVMVYKDQLLIFENYLKQKNDIKSLYNLFLDSINYLADDNDPDVDYNFILLLFIEIYQQYKSEQNSINKELIKKYFENLNLNLLENKTPDGVGGKNKPNLNLNSKYLELFSNIDDNLRDELISITGNKEEINLKIDVFLGFYYVFFKPELFIKFLNISNEIFKEIKCHLLSNKKIFNNFNSYVLDFVLLDQAKSYQEMLIIIKTFVPNMVELFKILLKEDIFQKMKGFKEVVLVLEFCKPQKEDDILSLCEYFEEYINLCNQERLFTAIINNDFFIQYCKFFSNEDYKKIEIIHTMLDKYNSILAEKSRLKIDNIIDKYFHDTGIYLISNQKLTNNAAFEFLKKDNYFENPQNKIPFDLISKGIIFDEEDQNFLNKFLNNEIDDFDINDFFGIHCSEFYKSFFKKFEKPRDLLCIKNWDINYNTNEIVINAFLEQLVIIWKNYPENHMYYLERLIGNALGKASQVLGNYKEYIKQLEEKISSNLLMSIYAEILHKDFSLSPEFQDHIINYIKTHCSNNALSIWFRLTTIKYVDDEESENNFLEDNLKEEFAIQPKCFVSYPANSDERIILFALLYNGKYFNKYENLTELPYYQKSINSKDEIYNLNYKEVIEMQKNLYDFQNLFLILLPGPFYEENIFMVDSILISFTDNINRAKNFFELLKKINNYWKTFFSAEKQNEINELKNLMSEYENTPLNQCDTIMENHSFYLKFKDKANEGEQLMGKIFFMSIYNSNKDKYNNDTDKFNHTYQQFNELKKLEKDINLDSLGKDFNNILAKALYDNGVDKLNDELKFIISFFNLKLNNNKISKIRKNFKQLVKQYQEENNLEDNLHLDAVENEDINIIIEEKIEDKSIIENQIIEEKKSLIDNFNTLGKTYFLESKKFKTTNNNNELKINEYFKNFYLKLFEINYGFCKLDMTELNKIISLSNEIYINAIGLGLMKQLTDNSLLLISEYNDIYKAIIYHNKNNTNDVISKILSFFKLLKYIKDYDNNSKNDNDGLFKNFIYNIFDLIKENVKDEKINDLLNKILIKEKKKKKSDINHIDILFEIILRKESNKLVYIYDNQLPIQFIDEVFYGDKKDEDKINFKSRYIPKINNICDEKKIFEEMILFYFEKKIMMMLNEKYNNARDLIVEENIDILKKYQTELSNYKKDYNQRNTTKKLYYIAFIKCFYYKLVKYLCEVNKGDISDIVKYIRVISVKEFKITLEMYIYKLFFDNIGNYNGFKSFGFNDLYQIDFIANDKDLESIISNNILESDKNCYGFDYLFLPIKHNFLDEQKHDFIFNIKEKDNKNYSLLLKGLLKIANNNETNNPGLIEIINNNNGENIDFFYCGVLNVHLSNYYKDNYFMKDQYKNMNNWINEIIVNKKINILNENEILSKILLLFKDEFNKITANLNQLSYDKLLCILISGRYVLNTLSSNNKEGLFYNLVVEPQKTISDCEQYFKYYLRDFKTFCEKKIDINYLTYRIINYIIISHIYFGFLLGNINDRDAINLLSLSPRDNNLLTLLSEEFDFINNNLLKVIGIKKIIIFMNYIFEQVSKVIININYDIDNDYIKQTESEIDNYINEAIFKYENFVEDYYLKIKDFDEPPNDDNQIQNIHKDIFYENNEFYNSEETEKKFQFIQYFTSTNFCTYDDFKSQYLYFEESESENYPMIDYILKKNNLIELINLIPKMNEFINDIYNRLSLKISEADLDKEILNINILQDFELDSFNNVLNEIKNKIDFKEDINITQKSKISEIVNVKDNKINRLYNAIINEYNKFLRKTKIYDINKDKMETVVIQNSSENDYMIFKYYVNNKNGNNEYNMISAEERLKEILILCSSRNRIKNEKINVYDGGKINYNYELIENMLEEEFILGKKIFSINQKTFISSLKFYNDDSNNLLIELNQKFPQKEIRKDIIENISQKIENEYNSEKKIIECYYNLQYIIIYLMTYEKNNKYINCETPIIDLIKIVEKANYKINDDFTSFVESLNDCLYINGLLSFYELVELKAFQYLTKGIKIAQIKIKQETKDKIEDELKNNNLLLNDKILTNGFKKFILRYYLADNDNNNLIEYLTKYFEDLFNKIDIWGNRIINDERLNKERENLISINNDDNCIIKYYCNKLFTTNEDKKIKNINPSINPFKEPDDPFKEHNEGEDD